jgi:S-formylglutathione hydrolase
MGGGGAIQCALKNKNYFKSVSAFSPICSFFKSNLAKLAMENYFNNETKLIEEYDPISLVKNSNLSVEEILIDVGLDDEFLDQLYIDEFYKHYKKNSEKITLRKHKEFSHNYYFIHSFVADHIHFHANKLTIA